MMPLDVCTDIGRSLVERAQVIVQISDLGRIVRYNDDAGEIRRCPLIWSDRHDRDRSLWAEVSQVHPVLDKGVISCRGELALSQNDVIVRVEDEDAEVGLLKLCTEAFEEVLRELERVGR